MEQVAAQISVVYITLPQGIIVYGAGVSTDPCSIYNTTTGNHNVEQVAAQIL